MGKSETLPKGGSRLLQAPIRVHADEMSTPSPGPGWWLASDGKWYPQQWEYTFRTASGSNALNDLMNKADELGQWGWEMVNYTIDERGGVTMQAMFKRPITP